MNDDDIQSLAPERNPTNTPYWDSLLQGRLTFQACTSCGHRWLPPRSECPSCLSDQWTWQTASGQAKLISWVVYHIAHHKAFEHRIPYNVAVVQLKEGPRLISNVVNITDHESLHIDQPLRLVIEQEGEVALPRFVPTGT